jgi:hypothetical protein
VSDIGALASCRKLRALHVADTRVARLDALASCAELRTLDICDTRVHDIDVLLAACPRLENLLLSRRDEARFSSALSALRARGVHAPVFSVRTR